MKNLITTSYLFVCLAILLFSSSCQVVEKDIDLAAVNVESEGRSEDDYLTFKGTVYEPVHRNCCFDEDLLANPLPNAKVVLPTYDLSTITDSLGNYFIKLPLQQFLAVNGKDALYTTQEIRFEVGKRDYIESILTYDYLAFYEDEDYKGGTGYVRNILEVDFPLTPRNESQMVTPAGGDFRFGDMMVRIPKDAVTKETSLAVTALHPMEYKGKSYMDLAAGIQATELERIEVFPLNLQLEKPIQIAYEDDIFFDFNTIQVAKLNEERNNWGTQLLEQAVKNHIVNFITEDGGTFMVKTLVPNHNCGLLYDELTVVGQAEDELSNCECGEPTVVQTKQQKLAYEEIEYSQVVSPDMAVEIIRQIRRAANIPSSRSLCNFSGRKLVYQGSTDSEEITLDKCSTASMLFDQRVRTIYGEIYGVHVVYQYYYTVDLDKEIGRCSDTSTCHQGCTG